MPSIPLGGVCPFLSFGSHHLPWVNWLGFQRSPDTLWYSGLEVKGPTRVGHPKGGYFLPPVGPLPLGKPSHAEGSGAVKPPGPSEEDVKCISDLLVEADELYQEFSKYREDQITRLPPSSPAASGTEFAEAEERLDHQWDQIARRLYRFQGDVNHCLEKCEYWYSENNTLRNLRNELFGESLYQLYRVPRSLPAYKDAEWYFRKSLLDVVGLLRNVGAAVKSEIGSSPTPTKLSPGERIAAWKKRTSHSYTFLADTAGILRNTLLRIRKGQSTRRDAVEAVAEVIECEPEDLLPR